MDNAAQTKDTQKLGELSGNETEQDLNKDIAPQRAAVKVFKGPDRITIAAAMPGLEPEDISVQVKQGNQVVLDGALRGTLKGDKDVLMNEWNPGPFHREVTLPSPINGEMANVTYNNGVLMVVLPMSDQTRTAQIKLDQSGIPTHGWRVGNAGHPVESQSEQALKGHHPERPE